MNLTFLKAKAKVKGIFSPPDMPYTPLIEDGNSAPYFGTYEGQRYGQWDTNSCWDFSAAELVETRLHMLRDMNLIPADTLKWLNDNGYTDSDGDFYVSRRWIAILSGVKSNGNNQLNFWKIARISGIIPNSMLPYSVADASKWITRQQFDNDYFNPSVITPAMRAMGQEFLKRFSIGAVNIGNDSNTLLTYLKEGSLQVGHPVPQDGTWNRQFVDTPPGRIIADHATELYNFDSTQQYPYFDYDSYNPHLKQLAKDYPLLFVTRVRIWPLQLPSPAPINPKPVFSLWMRMWFNFTAWIQGQPMPFPDTPVG